MNRRVANTHIPAVNARAAVLTVCVVAIGLLASCSSKPTDMRTLVPADTLIYLETNDLGTALQPLANSKSYQAIDGSKPDFGSLNGVQLAIAITGIETVEQKLNDEQSTAQVKPKFVAVADTHAWDFQARRFVDEKLGALVERLYQSKPQVETVEKNGGRETTWTAADGRKAVALVIGSVVYFSNDRESLNKAVATRNGAANIASTGKVEPTAPDVLASGYMSAPGVSQVSEVAGIRLATTASAEDPQVRSAVALILPQLLREMVQDVRWTAAKADGRVAETYEITMPPNMASALKDTQPDELQLRLRNAVVGLLEGSKLDPKTRDRVADVIASIATASDEAQTGFTQSGLERRSLSDAGLIGQIAEQLAVTQ